MTKLVTAPNRSDAGKRGVRRRAIARAIAVLLVVGVALVAIMFVEARADPVVRRARLVLPGLIRPLRVVLASDIHLGSLAMDAARLNRIAGRIEALRPDLILIAGDFIDGHEAGSAQRIAPGLVAPLARLRAPLGTVAVLGNHDHWTGRAAVATALARAGVILLDNQIAVRGPIAIGGVGDDYSRHADPARTIAAARASGRPWLLLTHSPDIAPDLPADARIVLAGHMHCGQAQMFGITFAPPVSRYGGRYRCGLVEEGTRRVIVAAGLGTSRVPLRLNAPPDLWLLTLTGR